MMTTTNAIYELNIAKWCRKMSSRFQLGGVTKCAHIFECSSVSNKKPKKLLVQLLSTGIAQLHHYIWKLTEGIIKG